MPANRGCLKQHERVVTGRDTRGNINIYTQHMCWNSGSNRIISNSKPFTTTHPCNSHKNTLFLATGCFHADNQSPIMDLLTFRYESICRLPFKMCRHLRKFARIYLFRHVVFLNL